MATPTVPPRPTRANAGPTAVRENMATIPPRPIRKLDPSPSRDARSPLNELPNPMASVGKRSSQSSLRPFDVPPRPPSVTLPSIGQEGNEYASFDQLPPEAHGVRFSDMDKPEVAAPEQTRNVSDNIPLHAPKASIPQSTATSRIATVTHTDSTQAAAAGIGQSRPDDDVHNAPADSSTNLSRVTSKTEDSRRAPSTELHPLQQKTSFNRSSSSLPQGTSRPGSIHESIQELGIPEIGMQIPLNPMAGDVQAPSPNPTQSQHTPGVGFFNDGSARAHNRKRSSRHEFGPPGSYGMHGHGQEPHDQFERDWAVKHPGQVAKEGANSNFFGRPRPETALSSAELNRIVTQSSDVGMGSDPNMIGTPGEDIAWEATEEYTSRMSSPLPSPAVIEEGKKRQSSDAETAKSSLRKMSFPFNEAGRNISDDAIRDDEGNVIHIDLPERKHNKVTGGGAVDGTLDLGPRGGNTEEEGGWYDERGEGTPILASDEIMKRPGSAFMQPAVPPESERVGDDYYDSDYGYQDSSRRNSLRAPSRPSSRPNSVHGEYQGGNLHRFISHEEYHGSGMHTPLEEIEEYEPLIPEGEEEAPKPKAKAQLKRPGLEHHHFPSQDIWEDTPSSLQYSTTVETPEPSREMKAFAAPPSTSTTFETPEEEHQTPNDVATDAKAFMKPQFKAGVQEEMGGRPGVQRFPSRDIWEDTPDSMRLVTTVGGPQMDETKSPPDDRPTTTAIPGSQDDDEARATTTGFTQVRRPSIPTRPHRKSKLAEELKPEGLEQSEKDASSTREISESAIKQEPSPDKAKAPAIPDRPKPTVPARPARPSRAEQADGAPLAKSTSADSQASTETVTAAPVPKSKPAVPARPGGGKFAALKAGFMSDLNSRLQLGPQGPPPKAKELEPEVAEETQKAPLADARKGRAKGPARRKPAASPSAATEEKPVGFSMSSMLTLWQIDENDELLVPSSSAATPAEAEVDVPALEKVLSENTARNTAEPTLAQPMTPEKAEATVSAQPSESIGAEGDEPEPSITVASVENQEAIQSELQASLAGSEPASSSAEVVEMKDSLGSTAVPQVEDVRSTPLAGEGPPAEVPAAVKEDD